MQNGSAAQTIAVLAQRDEIERSKDYLCELDATLRAIMA